MKRTLWLALLLWSVIPCAAQTPASPHVMITANEMKWSDVPPMLPKGAKLSVLSGDPGKEGMFVVRLKMPAGYRVPPHWHPTDEHVTVIKGNLALGMGDKADVKKAKALHMNGYALLPATMHHYAIAKEATVVEIWGNGPFVINYVNPADDPSKK